MIDYSNMKDGDRAGLSLFRDTSAWIGVKRDNGAYVVGFTTGLTMNTDWTTANTGSTTATTSISGGTIYLRITADIAPSGTKTAQFYYSSNGSTWTQLGGSFSMNTNWTYFMGYRFGIFNYATSSLGGSVKLSYFDLGAGASGSGTTTTSTTKATTLTTTGVSKTTTTTASNTTTASSSGCTSALYGQCAGIGFTGCTVCASGSTCKYSNDCKLQITRSIPFIQTFPPRLLSMPLNAAYDLLSQSCPNPSNRCHTFICFQFKHVVSANRSICLYLARGPPYPPFLVRIYDLPAIETIA